MAVGVWPDPDLAGHVFQRPSRGRWPGPRELSGGSLQCRNCGKLFTFAYNMIRHRRKCEGNFHLRCPACGQGFNRRDKYSLHLLKHGLPS